MIYRALIMDGYGTVDCARIEAKDKERAYEFVDVIQGNNETWILYDEEEWKALKECVDKIDTVGVNKAGG